MRFAALSAAPAAPAPAASPPATGLLRHHLQAPAVSLEAAFSGVLAALGGAVDPRSAASLIPAPQAASEFSNALHTPRRSGADDPREAAANQLEAELVRYALSGVDFCANDAAEAGDGYVLADGVLAELTRNFHCVTEEAAAAAVDAGAVSSFAAASLEQVHTDALWMALLAGGGGLPSPNAAKARVEGVGSPSRRRSSVV